VLAHGHAVLELEDVQLLRAAAQVLGLEAEIVGGDPLETEHLLVEAERFLEVPSADAEVIEPDRTHVAHLPCVGHTPAIVTRQRRCPQAVRAPTLGDLQAAGYEAGKHRQGSVG
jgi:hypothetical protein